MSNDFELFFGLVSPIGVNVDEAIKTLSTALADFGCRVEVINIQSLTEPLSHEKNICRKEIDSLVSSMPRLRKLVDDAAIQGVDYEDIYARLAVNKINELRSSSDLNCYIIEGFKHPSEIETFRNIYDKSFYAIGLTSSVSDRIRYQTGSSVNESRSFQAAREVYEDFDFRIEGRTSKYKNNTAKAYQLSDFFINLTSSEYRDYCVDSEIQRIVDLIFGAPTITPREEEHSMFMAYMYSTRSADLSRQVGAVIANRRNDVLSFGANEVPKSGGGQYWSESPYIAATYEGVKEIKLKGTDHRDYVLGSDANADVKNEIFDEIFTALEQQSILIDNQDIKAKALEALRTTTLNDITEFGRVVHAEMSAITAAARNGISISDAKMFCTTYPCHNCAKHIVASGVSEVVYIEPYPKSRANSLHSDAIFDPDAVAQDGKSKEDVIRQMVHHFRDDEVQGCESKVHFRPYSGVGPRLFLDLFSMKLGSGRALTRKRGSSAIALDRERATPRFNSAKTHNIVNESSYLSGAPQFIEQIGGILSLYREDGKRKTSVIKYVDGNIKFIKSEYGSRDFFFSADSYLDSDSDQIKVGNIVNFEIAKSGSGELHARNLKFGTEFSLKSEVKSWNPQTQKGFITRIDKQSKDYIFYGSGLVDPEKDIAVGEKVEFSTSISPKGIVFAMNIRATSKLDEFE
ncbi:MULTISPECIES: deaminase [Pseudoalteromonas]|uniref:deaminase n=1 Tax=Pseudoalteromonas TaxID=53246 RepID=UPI000696F434|nr:deaminase [Pseudoalteromonas piscicida]